MERPRPEPTRADARNAVVGEVIVGIMNAAIFAFIGMIYAVRVIVPLAVVYGLWQIFGQ